MLYFIRPTRLKTLLCCITTWVVLNGAGLTRANADEAVLALAQAERLAGDRDALGQSISARAQGPAPPVRSRRAVIRPQVQTGGRQLSG